MACNLLNNSYRAGNETKEKILNGKILAQRDWFGSKETDWMFCLSMRLCDCKWIVTQRASRGEGRQWSCGTQDERKAKEGRQWSEWSKRQKVVGNLDWVSGKRTSNDERECRIGRSNETLKMNLSLGNREMRRRQSATNRCLVIDEVVHGKYVSSDGKADANTRKFALIFTLNYRSRVKNLHKLSIQTVKTQTQTISVRSR